MNNNRLVKLAVAGYLVKSLLLGAAWLLIPDLPERARAHAQTLWDSVAAAGRDR